MYRKNNTEFLPKSVKNGESVLNFLNYLTGTCVRVSVRAEGVICMDKKIKMLLKMLDELTEEEIEEVIRAFCSLLQCEQGQSANQADLLSRN